MYTIAVIVVLYFYVRLGMWVARKAASRYERKRIKLGVRVAVALVFILIPTGDWIAGRIYFNYLCETEAGVKVYQTIELPPEYWDEDGTPKFYKGANNNDIPSYAFKRLGMDINAEWKERQRWFQVDQFGTMITSRKSGQRLSEVVGFRYWGGWVARKMTPHNSSISCGGGDAYDDLVRQQFIPVIKKGE